MTADIKRLNDDEKKYYTTRQLFIHASDRDMVSVTDRAVIFDTVFPVMLDYQLWFINHMEGDVELSWLDNLLKICTNFYRSGVMVPAFSFDFARDQDCRQAIYCSLECDKRGYHYLLIRLHGHNNTLRLH